MKHTHYPTYSNQDIADNAIETLNYLEYLNKDCNWLIDEADKEFWEMYKNIVRLITRFTDLTDAKAIILTENKHE